MLKRLLLGSFRPQVLLLGADHRVEVLPSLRQQPGSVSTGAPPQPLLPERDRVGGQCHGDELGGCQEHCPARVPPLEPTGGPGGPERPDAQDQNWAMTSTPESQGICQILNLCDGVRRGRGQLSGFSLSDVNSKKGGRRFWCSEKRPFESVRRCELNQTRWRHWARGHGWSDWSKTPRRRAGRRQQAGDVLKFEGTKAKLSRRIIVLFCLIIAFLSRLFRFRSMTYFNRNQAWWHISSLCLCSLAGLLWWSPAKKIPNLQWQWLCV